MSRLPDSDKNNKDLPVLFIVSFVFKEIFKAESKENGQSVNIVRRINIENAA